MTDLEREWDRTEQQLAHVKMELIWYHNKGEKNLSPSETEMLKYIRESCVDLGNWRYEVVRRMAGSR